MRTLHDAAISKPSADLLDTIYLCQLRQDCFRDYLLENSMDPVPYVGSATTMDEPAIIAQRMRDLLGISPDAGPLARNWGSAFSLLSDRIEDSGTLVMVSGVVGSNTRRVLQPEEFCGFTLADDLAPLVFVNGADSKAAQIFTLLHEFAHVWLGGSALSDAVPGATSAPPDEQWCNAVAAEVLMPRETVRAEYIGDQSAEGLDALAQRFTVSTLVVLRRLADLSLITKELYYERYEEEKAGGGSFYNVQPRRLSRQFARAVIASAREGGTSYRDAYKLLGTKKYSTFEQLAERVGIS
ncbi:ImmA/IrrE family metallo-endopeptidase [Brachybacterium sp. p3-SID957]|uniref:ImmA/IrrE family metallo-endopeptidase n=1 Tax=Brachybacterium sp. p3-SID957 TaxID=2916049 RepID=UPI00223BA766|nr:ImmA/IrrE family metallo-endopeptidase [Brachybacterium sp. p3-SID957]MCT1776955.1 ImmA/IrrE family metallo-endopeptidase [Brachybacterium sp. p3-SID957]